MYDAYNNDSITTQLIWDNPYIAESSIIHQNMCLTEEHKMPLKHCIVSVSQNLT